MGAWGIHTFEDDHNLDWLNDLVEQDKPLAFFKECLDLEGIDELEYMACAGVVCTAVMIDALLNGPTKDLPATAVEWIEENKKRKVTRLVTSAVKGLARVLEDSSEMYALWMENEELGTKWKRRLTALKKRLEKAVPQKPGK